MNNNTQIRPVKIEGYSSKIAARRKEKKRLEAEIRQEKYDSLSVKEKLSVISKRPGKSKKEVARLRKI